MFQFRGRPLNSATVESDTKTLYMNLQFTAYTMRAWTQALPTRHFRLAPYLLGGGQVDIATSRAHAEAHSESHNQRPALHQIKTVSPSCCGSGVVPNRLQALWQQQAHTAHLIVVILPALDAKQCALRPAAACTYMAGSVLHGPRLHSSGVAPGRWGFILQANKRNLVECSEDGFASSSVFQADKCGLASLGL